MIAAVAVASRRMASGTSSCRVLAVSTSALHPLDCFDRRPERDSRTSTRLGATRSMSELPYHLVVGMPALSPTMEAGTIAKWNIGEGESFSAGDSIAEIETDKATIDFEAQDDGVIAKHLVPAGSEELKVGVPIMVTVEESEDVAAFKDFVVEAGASEPATPAGEASSAPTPPAPSAAATPAADLPYHLVVGMPALSPTMEAGTISKWNIGEGESFSAGDSIAEIETDKATIDFEAQDDGVIAKHLVPAGSGELKVGVPIMVTVEESEDVAAFKDFEVGAEPTEPAAPAATAPEEEAPPPPATAAVDAAPPAPAAAPTPAVEESVPLAATVAPPMAATTGPSWGKLALHSSPLAKSLAAQQKAYIDKYGSTGQIPL